MGELEIDEYSIKITKYPFEPSTCYPAREIQFDEIEAVHLDQYPPTIKLGNELIFISKEHLEALKDFANRNNLNTPKRASNWNWITEPFLDTEFDDAQRERTDELLENNGISREELKRIRNEISGPMQKYNFDSMLWEWHNLGLNDVLSAMMPILSKNEFRDFYWKAMEIEQRNT